ncbi:MAG: GNAT family N-acetyltransferase [Leptolyngbya sp. SIO4C1]|nr:GNAT family N-acetyltransferase [Leptolyngbya sp. SIO4C1]
MRNTAKKMAIQFRAAAATEDTIVAQHFYQMWRDLAVPADRLLPDWQSQTVEFIAQARNTLGFQAFIAIADTGEAVGSASCQIFSGLYPLILSPGYQQRGYLWGVYVDASYRRQGIATKLTLMAIAHLKQLGCTHALLNASPAGQPLYETLGFEPGNLMSLRLK